LQDCKHFYTHTIIETNVKLTNLTEKEKEKMPRLTYKARMIIGSQLETPSRVLVDELEKIEGIKYSHVAIYNYQKSLMQESNLTQVNRQNVTRSLVNDNPGLQNGPQKTISMTTIFQVTRVLNVLHVNSHANQKQTLREICGSSSTDAVRKWLLEQYQALL